MQKIRISESKISLLDPFVAGFSKTSRFSSRGPKLVMWVKVKIKMPLESFFCKVEKSPCEETEVEGNILNRKKTVAPLKLRPCCKDSRIHVYDLENATVFILHLETSERFWNYCLTLNGGARNRLGKFDKSYRIGPIWWAGPEDGQNGR